VNKRQKIRLPNQGLGKQKGEKKVLDGEKTRWFAHVVVKF